MEWSDDAIVLAARRHGESSSIVTLMTRDHGRHAGLDALGRRRQVEEVGLSALFLATLFVWANDGSPGQERTRKFLASRLSEADRVMGRLWPARDHNA